MELSQDAALIEAVLFLESEPLSLQELSKISHLGQTRVNAAVDLIKTHYETQGHGLEVVQLGGGYSLAPRAEFWDVLKERYGQRNSNRLSRAALETLSIIAYSQPITRAEIENIRGVAADGMIRLLQEKELIKQVGKKDAPGKPVQYGTTREFLKVFKLNSIADLPSLSDLDRDRFEEEE